MNRVLLIFSSKNFQPGCWRFRYGAWCKLQGSLTGSAGVSLLSVYFVQHKACGHSGRAPNFFSTTLFAPFQLSARYSGYIEFHVHRLAFSTDFFSLIRIKAVLEVVQY